MAKQHKEKPVVDKQEYHVIDFLNRCKINRNQYEIYMKKYESAGVKTLVEWEVVTGLKMIKLDF